MTSLCILPTNIERTDFEWPELFGCIKLKPFNRPPFKKEISPTLKAEALQHAEQMRWQIKILTIRTPEGQSSLTIKRWTILPVVPGHHRKTGTRYFCSLTAQHAHREGQSEDLVQTTIVIRENLDGPVEERRVIFKRQETDPVVELEELGINNKATIIASLSKLQLAVLFGIYVLAKTFDAKKSERELMLQIARAKIASPTGENEPLPDKSINVLLNTFFSQLLLSYPRFEKSLASLLKDQPNAAQCQQAIKELKDAANISA